MPIKSNAHVARILRVNESYEERTSEHNSGVETQAYKYLIELLESDPPRLVVLTGDAGHGKTHLCRRILEAAGYQPGDAIALMTHDPRGLRAIRPRDGRSLPALRIVKDLTEIEPKEDAAAVLHDLLIDTSSTAIVCANEGRLRDVLSVPGQDGTNVILDTLTASIRDGVTSLNDSVHVVNLNYQSVTGGSPSFLEQILRHWVEDNRRWRACESCDADPWCPIRRNQRQLRGADGDPSAPSRIDGLNDLIRIVEESGYVLTIRECLVLLAFLLTGGRSCEDVANESGALKKADHDFTDYLFTGDGARELPRALPVLAKIRRLDPGLRGIREIDDLLQGHADRILASDDGLATPPRNKKQKQKQTDTQRNTFRRLRRDDFFTLALGKVDRGARVGLRHRRAFEVAVESDQVVREDWIIVRDQLVSGLHVVQGLRPKSTTYFYLADPAFARANVGAAIIAARISLPDVKLMSRKAYWEARGESAHRVVESVDWLERGVVVQFGESDQVLDLDLLRFEFVMQAAGGVALRHFYGPEIRRTLAELASVVETGFEDHQSQIELLVGPVLKNIQLDVGGQIRVGDF